MSKPSEQKPEDKKGRVKVDNLPQRETEVKEREAANIKGGGGASGGVVMNKSRLLHIGEEIPQ